MAEKPSSYEKGLALELKLLELFRKMGYSVIHDTKRVGRSGAQHQIDVLAEYRCPLHNSTLVIEAKSYDSPIDKDRIMKLIQIVDDIGADRGIIVTTSYFTPEAIKTASGHNVELWSREQLVKLLGEVLLLGAEKGLPEEVSVKERAVKPVLTIQDAESIERSILQQRAKGGFLGAGKIVERFDSVTLQYFPFYEAEVQTTVSEVEKTGLLSKRTVQKNVNTRISIDALRGDISTVNENGICFPYPFLKRLNEDEIKVFRSMMGGAWYSSHNIVGQGFSEGKARKILSGLANAGAVESGKGARGVAIYRSKIPFPIDPRVLRSISDVFQMEDVSEADAKFISPVIKASDIIKRIESYWNAKVNNISVSYYPYYVINLKTQDGSQRTDMINAIRGNLMEL
ncbi:restriction endonuclease [Candidatus Bathyarchaeota archaeon]|nr:restriction endonuclease [Candidatus Bathyarchaeota archaeon]